MTEIKLAKKSLDVLAKDSFFNLIGSTPLVQLKKIPASGSLKLFGKCEGDNPGSSVKDRASFFMMHGAEQQGRLSKEVCLIEATSGNTGVALAMLAARRGYKIELVMPEDATSERMKAMVAFGAKLILTPSRLQMEGAIDYVKDKLSKDPDRYHNLDQFSNPHNPIGHYLTTGPEIWEATKGKITHFISSMGTTGTITGVGRYLKEKNPKIKIIGVQPTKGARIPGIRRWPKEYEPKIFDPALLDEIVEVSQAEATGMSRRLAKYEGLLTGMSSGGSVQASTVVAARMKKEEKEQATLVCILCDRGDRYLSSELFREKK